MDKPLLHPKYVRTTKNLTYTGPRYTVDIFEGDGNEYGNSPTAGSLHNVGRHVRLQTRIQTTQPFSHESADNYGLVEFEHSTGLTKRHCSMSCFAQKCHKLWFNFLKMLL